MKQLENILRAIQDNQRFLITSHARSDGDSIGSSLALAQALTQAGKAVRILHADPAPDIYRSLPGIDRIEVGTSPNEAFDVLIVLECNDLERTGVSGLEAALSINLDHHSKNDHFADFNWVDPNASAVAELVFQIVEALKIEMTPEMATNLYVAIMTDTGSFQYLNTTADTFRIAGQLVASGAAPAAIAQDIYMTQSESKLRLLSRVLATLSLDPTRQVAWVSLDREMLEQTGAKDNDTEGFVNYPLSLEGVKICAFFREVGPESYRVSLRSKKDFDVNRVAQSFGGGGHVNAAGLSLSGSFDEVTTRLISRLTELLPAN